jgi:hypothetical protein
VRINSKQLAVSCSPNFFDFLLLIILSLLRAIITAHNVCGSTDQDSHFHKVSLTVGFFFVLPGTYLITVQTEEQSSGELNLLGYDLMSQN